MRKILDDKYVIALLKDAIDDAGSQKLFAAKHDMSQQFLCDVLNKRRAISDKILIALGLKKVVHYERIN